jgi:hypothetical protein
MSSFPTRCMHVKINGTLCGSPALRGRRFCFFHKRWRAQRIRLNAQPQSNPQTMLRLPVLEDANSIQIVLTQVMRLILTRQIDSKTAGLLLYALQTASINLKQTYFDPTPTSVILDPRDARDTPVDEIPWSEEDFEDDEGDDEREAEDEDVDDEDEENDEDEDNEDNEDEDEEDDQQDEEQASEKSTPQKEADQYEADAALLKRLLYQQARSELWEERQAQEEMRRKACGQRRTGPLEDPNDHESPLARLVLIRLLQTKLQAARTAKNQPPPAATENQDSPQEE